MCADREVPLYVDLDGSVLRSDTLWESFASALRRHPVRTVTALFALASGRAALKRRLAQLGSPEIETLPLHERFVAWLREQRAAGRRVVLATAADRVLAEALAARVGVFDHVLASDGRRNLKGRRKLAAIRGDAGGAPFDYCGNGPEDVAIFAAARRAVLVGASPRVQRAAQSQAEVTAVFEPRPTRPSIGSSIRNEVSSGTSTSRFFSHWCGRSAPSHHSSRCGRAGLGSNTAATSAWLRAARSTRADAPTSTARRAAAKIATSSGPLPQ